jgi:hypothetical protein
MSALLDAVDLGDLESVKRLVREGADVKETFDGFTTFVRAASQGHIPIMHWLLTEGGSSLAERDLLDAHALSLTARCGHFAAMQYLLEEQGASITVRDRYGDTVWNDLWTHCRGIGIGIGLISLLKVMVMLEDAPADFIVHLSPQHAELCTRGRQLRAQLPSYLEQQWAAVVTHCSLPAVLQSLVAAYAVTTPEDMWADGLRVQAPRAKRGRTKVEKEDAEDALLCVGPFDSARSTQDSD